VTIGTIEPGNFLAWSWIFPLFSALNSWIKRRSGVMPRGLEAARAKLLNASTTNKP